jgi:thioredoxin reductase (NADPH)
MAKEYELIIIGGGPAGLTAGIYASRARRKTVLLEKQMCGGQMALTWEVENYPGVGKISGFELGQRMEAQAKEFGLEIATAEVSALARDEDRILLSTTDGDYSCRALVIASGARHNRLGVPGEADLTGKGVSYCATCDGAFFKGAPVAVVGGGDTALEEAHFLTRFADKVHIIHRRDEFRAVKYLQEKIQAEAGIVPVLDSVVEKVEGSEKVTGVLLKNVKSGATSTLEVEGVFIFVGVSPNTEFLKGFVPTDERGFVVTNEHLETAVPGVFAAGDVRVKKLRQIATAVGEGAEAAVTADHYLG